MKFCVVLCMFVAGAASYSITSVRSSNSGYIQEEIPQLSRVIESRPTAFNYDAPLSNYSPMLVRTESSYGQRQLLKEVSAVREEIPITKFRHLINPSSAEYNLRFETGNGILSEESGSLKNVPVARLVSGGSSYGYGKSRLVESVEAVQTKSGETSWCSPEGLRFTLTYTADETGYHPQITKGLCQPAYQPTRLFQAPAYEQTRLVQTHNY